MKKIQFVFASVIILSANPSFAATTECFTDHVTLGTFDLGSWNGNNGALVISEPPVGSNEWIYDHDTLDDKHKKYINDCDVTAATLIRRVSTTFPRHKSNAEYIFDQSARVCKNTFNDRHDFASKILCP